MARSAMTLQRYAEAAWTWLLEHTAEPTDEPRPTPVTGEAWLVAGLEHNQPSVTYVTDVPASSDEPAKELVHC